LSHTKQYKRELVVYDHDLFSWVLAFKSLIRFPNCQTTTVWFGLMWCASLCLNPQSNCKFLVRSLIHCTKQYEYWCKY